MIYSKYNFKKVFKLVHKASYMLSHTGSLMHLQSRDQEEVKTFAEIRWKKMIWIVLENGSHVTVQRQNWQGKRREIGYQHELMACDKA